MRFAVLLLFAPMSSAATGSDTPRVEISMPPVLSPSMNFAFLGARAVVAALFSDIGVTVEWSIARSGSHNGCSKQPGHPRILVTFSESTPARFHEGALAFSNPYSTRGACMTVFMDRLEPFVRRNPLSAPFFLGHVLAHEMAHILQGIDRHSGTGLLRKKWSVEEIRKMPYERLRFTPYDAELILQGMGGAEDNR